MDQTPAIPNASAAPQATNLPPGVTDVGAVQNAAPANPGQIMQTGGAVKAGFFDDVDFVGLGFGILLATGISYVIYFYRYKTKTFKAEVGDLKKQISDLKAQIDSDNNAG